MSVSEDVEWFIYSFALGWMAVSRNKTDREPGGDTVCSQTGSTGSTVCRSSRISIGAGKLHGPRPTPIISSRERTFAVLHGRDCPGGQSAMFSKRTALVRVRRSFSKKLKWGRRPCRSYPGGGQRRDQVLANLFSRRSQNSIRCQSIHHLEVSHGTLQAALPRGSTRANTTSKKEFLHLVHPNQQRRICKCLSAFLLHFNCGGDCFELQIALKTVQ